MGLDTVELVMYVGKTFDIRIPDHDAEQMLSVGLMHEFIMRETSAMGRTLDPDEVWQSIVHLLVEDYGIPAAKINREARFIKDLGLD